MESLSNILKKYKSRDKWLGYGEAASMEAEIVREIEKNGASFAEFKKVVRFLRTAAIDDSATGLVYLYDALNSVLKEELAVNKAKDWQWIKENGFKDDRFLKTILSVYTDEKYQAEINTYLDAAEKEQPGNWMNFACFYKAFYMKLTGESGYEAYLDRHLSHSDIKRMKLELLIARGEREAAFELVRNDPELVPEAAELLNGKAREEYLLDCIINLREHYVGQKRIWWQKLCEIAGDKYLPELLSSPYHCEMANELLYKTEKYDELINRIDKGWIYDDLWGRLNDDTASKYHAVQAYKKLKKVYPDRCAQIMIDQAMFLINRNANRKSYRTGAKILVNAGKLSREAQSIVKTKAAEIIKQYPKRTAMIEEMENAGLV